MRYILSQLLFPFPVSSRVRQSRIAQSRRFSGPSVQGFLSPGGDKHFDRDTFFHEPALIVSQDPLNALLMQVPRQRPKNPPLLLQLLHRPLKERGVVCLEPDLPSEREQIRIDPQE